MKQADVKYVNKADYGKVPKYICKIKDEIKKENTEAARVLAQLEAEKNSKHRLLGFEERSVILEGLKAKWIKMNSGYQQITHMTVLDTLSKLKRKEYFETELKQIENDIKLLERNEDIYIDLDS